VRYDVETCSCGCCCADGDAVMQSHCGERKDLGSVDLGFESGVAHSRCLTDHFTCGRWGAMNGENAGRTLSVEGALVFLLQLRQNRTSVSQCNRAALGSVLWSDVR